MINEKIIDYIFTDIIEKCSRFDTFNESIYHSEEVGLEGIEFESEDFGDIEKELMKEYEDIEFSDKVKSMISLFRIGGWGVVNAYLQGKRTSEEVTKICSTHEIFAENGYGEDVEVMVKDLHDFIVNCPRLFDDMVLYHGGKWDDSLNVGDKGVFEGFTSTSLQKCIANRFSEGDGVAKYNEKQYVVKIYAPKGSKGAYISTESLDMEHGAKWNQHEIVLDRNQKFVVISRDDDKKEVEILLLKR